MAEDNGTSIPIQNVELDNREVTEIQHCLYYARELHHGTAGHNLLMLLAKLSEAHGFRLTDDQRSIFFVQGLSCVFSTPENKVALLTLEEWKELQSSAAEA